MRILALVTLATIVAGLFGGELLDPIGVPGIWFPFGIGVSRTQYVYAIVLPLLAFLIVRTLPFRENASIREEALRAGLLQRPARSGSPDSPGRASSGGRARPALLLLPA
jgi:hypothetical protein